MSSSDKVPGRGRWLTARKSTGGKAPRKQLATKTARKQSGRRSPRHSSYSKYSSDEKSDSSSLLDLPDNIIELIGSYVNNDINIPLPSYGPHWENYASSIHGDSSQDLNNFRSTCRSVWSLVKPQGSHIKIDRLDNPALSPNHWINQTPQRFLNSITRACVIMPKNKNDQPISVYEDLISMLPSFPFLEELYIEQIPLCHHEFNAAHPNQLNPQLLEPITPGHDILPNLLSLSITVSCTKCANHLISTLVPPSPKLQHLKYHLTLPECQSQTNWDLTKTFEEPFGRWCRRYCKDYVLLKTLYLRYPIPLSYPQANIKDSWKNVIHKAFKIFPKFEVLSVVQTKAFSEMYSKFHVNVSEPTGVCKKKSSDIEKEERKIIKINEDRGNGGSIYTLEKFILDLSPSRTLKYFDPIFAIDTRGSFPHIYSPKPNEQRSVSRKEHYNQLRVFVRDDNGNYQTQLRKDMELIARQLIKLIPSLEGGAFWKKGTMENQNDWYGWEWRLIGENELSTIEVDLKPWVYSPEFLMI